MPEQRSEPASHVVVGQLDGRGYPGAGFSELLYPISADATDAFTGRGLGAEPLAAQAYLRTLLNWRKTSRAARVGSLTQYVPDNGVYVYFRHLDTESVMVAVNKGTAPAHLDLGRLRESLARGEMARDAISGAPLTLLDELTLAPRSALVLDIR